MSLFAPCARFRPQCKLSSWSSGFANTPSLSLRARAPILRLEPSRRMLEQTLAGAFDLSGARPMTKPMINDYFVTIVAERARKKRERTAESIRNMERRARGP